MLGTEADIRADERGKVLDQVESALFGLIIGLTGDDPRQVAEHHKRMKHFMRLSDCLALMFTDWPNR